MKNLQDILGEITKITTNIITNYPELYIFLEETPFTIPSINNLHIDSKVMEGYLEDLKGILENYTKTREKV
jgi:hypothetical protein